MAGEASGEWSIVGTSRGKGSRRVKWEDLVAVFVSNLPEITAADQLRFAFSPVGSVIDAFIPASSGRGRGFCSGFVRFGDMEMAVRAVKLLGESWKLTWLNLVGLVRIEGKGLGAVLIRNHHDCQLSLRRI